MARSGSLYGLGIRSDVPIAALAGTRTPLRVDVEWTVEGIPAALDRLPEHAWRLHGTAVDDEDDAPVRVFHAQAHGLYRFEYADGTRAMVDRRGTRVWASTPAGATIEDTATYLLGPVMGFVLRLRGVPCLHASAVSVRGHAIAFAGHAGGGKSTLAATLGLRGHPVLTEDVLALRREDGVIRAAPGYPLVRLWPASAAALFGFPESLPRITPTWDKRFLALGGTGVPFEASAQPLGAVCILDDRGGHPRITRMDCAPALVWLVAHAYSARLLDRAMRAAEFERLAQLAAELPILRISAPASFSGVGEFLDELLDRVGAEHAPV